MASKKFTGKSAYYLKISDVNIRERYDEKIRKCDGIDPYTLKAKDLSSNQKDFPKITMKDIEDYMIYSVSPFSNQFRDNYKGTEAYTFFESGFVISIGSKKNDNSAIVKGKVKHSQSMNESPLQVWVLVSLDGKIICAHCTCITGLSETCSHVGAICFAVNKIVESDGNKSVTDILCKWNVPSFKEVSMSSAENITWKFSYQEKSAYETSFLELCESINPLSDETIDQFVLKSHSVGDETALGTIIFSSEKKRKTDIRDIIFLASLYNKAYRNKTIYELVEKGKSISLDISNDEANKMFKLTLPRRKSKCSLALRRGRVTGSTFKSCCETNIEDPCLTVIRRLINPNDNLNHVPSIKYQNQMKKKVIQHYNRLATSNHEDFLYEECGLIINPDMPYFAGALDGLVSCICHGDGCIEIKCMNIEEPNALDDYLTRKPNNILNKNGDQYSLERSHEYYYHVQFNINLTELKYCDCVIWSPRKAFVVRVYADLSFWKEKISKAIKFHESVIMPELLGKAYTKKIDLPNSNERRDEELNEEEHDEFELLSLEIELLGS